MPEQPESKRRKLESLPPDSPARRPPSVLPYAELHCKTNFSFLEGASHPDELVVAPRSSATRPWPSPIATAWRGWYGPGCRQTSQLEIAHRRGTHAHRRAGRGAVGDRPPSLRPIGATDYRRPAERPRANAGLTFDDIAASCRGLAGPRCRRPTTTAEELSRISRNFADRCYLLAELHRGPNDDRVLDAAHRAWRNNRACRWWPPTMCIFIIRRAGHWPTC